MKPAYLWAGALACLVSCKQTESYKDVRQQVSEQHDSIIVDSELSYRNKMRLDTLAKEMDSLKKLNPDLDTVKEKKRINNLRVELIAADDAMNDWMHQFDPEKGKKTDEQALAYFENEKAKVDSLDKMFKRLLKQSREYLDSITNSGNSRS